MATQLKLKNTTANGITDTGDGILYDMNTNFGASVDTCITNTTASGTEIQLTKTAGGSTVAWISGRAPAGGFTLTTSDISIWQRESDMSANTGGRFRVFKRSAAGVVTELGGGPFNDGVEMSATADREDLWLGNVTDTAFAENDRILLRVYLTNVGTMGGGFTATHSFNAATGATGDSFFNIAETITFKADTTVKNFADALSLSSLTSGPKLFKQVSIADALNLTSSIPNPGLSLITVKNFADLLALDSLISDSKLFRIINITDILNLTSQIDPVKLFRDITISDTLNITSNIANPGLFKQINYIDSLNLSSLISNPVLFKQIDLSDLISITSDVPNFELTTGNIINFTDSISITSQTTNPELLRQINYSDILSLNSLINDIKLCRQINYADILALNSLISNFDLSTDEAIRHGYTSYSYIPVSKKMQINRSKTINSNYKYILKDIKTVKTILNQ